MHDCGSKMYDWEGKSVFVWCWKMCSWEGKRVDAYPGNGLCKRIWKTSCDYLRNIVYDCLRKIVLVCSLKNVNDCGV